MAKLKTFDFDVETNWIPTKTVRQKPKREKHVLSKQESIQRNRRDRFNQKRGDV